MNCVDEYAHVYLSPHLDDAVLSCGGRIWQQGQAGESVAVVTVFAGAPEPDVSLSSYAQRLHARWGDSVDAVEERRKENREALALLGASVKNWPYRDCVYRRTPEGDYAYASEEALWGRIHPAEGDLVRELTGRVSALPLTLQATLYVPLAVGGHVDHRIVRRAAEEFGTGHHRWSLTYYEDFPYAAEPGSVRAAGPSLAEDGWEAELVPLSQEALEAKMAAIARYRSQMSTFWTDRAEMAASVRAFAERRGAGRSAEWYWRPTESLRTESGGST
jgi:LmbE family N-acetylglucosaminyl deacetylase